jgi:hypothetical protein
MLFYLNLKALPAVSALGLTSYTMHWHKGDGMKKEMGGMDNCILICHHARASWFLIM